MVLHLLCAVCGFSSCSLHSTRSCEPGIHIADSVCNGIGCGAMESVFHQVSASLLQHRSISELRTSFLFFVAAAALWITFRQLPLEKSFEDVFLVGALVVLSVSESFHSSTYVADMSLRPIISLNSACTSPFVREPYDFGAFAFSAPDYRPDFDRSAGTWPVCHCRNIYGWYTKRTIAAIDTQNQYTTQGLASIQRSKRSPHNRVDAL